MVVTARVCIAIALALPLAGCVVGEGGDDGSEDTSNVEFEAAGTPQDINLGFNGAAGEFGVSQFAFYPDFFNIPGSFHPGPRVCHTYIAWDIANEPEAMGNAQSPAGRRAAFEYWLAHAQTDGQCQEVLLSLHGYAVDGNGPIPGATCADGTAPPCDPPTEAQLRAAFATFLATDWAGETGYTGKFAFTPWNEPNNPGGAGNGLGKIIEAERAARFYLAMESLCKQHGCKVAAGDLASNGSWPADFGWNCANDNIQNLTVTRADGKKWCRHASSKNPGNQLPASWLDRYKNSIALHAHEYPGVPDRPEYFAYHAWHDVNQYINGGVHCDSYENCVTRRLLKSLGGSWRGVAIWDTEIGASQGADLSNDQQACAAAFLVRLSTINARIQRIYYTRLHNGGVDAGGELIGGDDPATATARPAGTVLALRQSHYAPPVPAPACQ
jgi:hypothetical protein